MAGLDTRGIVSGFAQGYGLAANIHDDKKRRERDEEALQWAREDRRDAQSDRTRRLGIEDQRFAWEQDNQRRNTETHQRNMKVFDEQEARQRMQSLYANLETAGELAESDWQSIGTIRRDFPHLVPRDLQDGYFARKYERATGEIQQLLTNPERATPEMLDDLEDLAIPLSRAVSPENGRALAIAEDVMNPETPTNMRSPEVIDAVNQLWGPRIGEGKKIVGIFPGQQPGTLTFEVSVEGQEGTRPMTAKRGTAEEGDNEVMQVPVEALMEELMDAKALYQAFEANPAARERVLGHGRIMGLAPEREKQERGFSGVVEQPGLGLGQYGPDGRWYGIDAAEEEQGGYSEIMEQPGLGMGQFGPDGRWYPINEPKDGSSRGSGDRTSSDLDRYGQNLYTAAQNRWKRFDMESGSEAVDQDAALAEHTLAMELARQNSYGITPQEALHAITSAVSDQAQAYLQQEGVEPTEEALQQVYRSLLIREFETLRTNMSGGGQQRQGAPNVSPQTGAVLQQFISGGTSAQNESAGIPSRDQLMQGGGQLNQPASQPEMGGLRAPAPITPQEQTGPGRSSQAGRAIHSTLDGVQGLVNTALDRHGGLVDWIGNKTDNSYAQWAQSIVGQTTGGLISQTFRSQSPEDYQAGRELNAFLGSRQGREIIGNDPHMRRVFEQDPEGFVHAVKSGIPAQSIEQWLIQSGRIADMNADFPAIR